MNISVSTLLISSNITLLRPPASQLLHMRIWIALSMPVIYLGAFRNLLTVVVIVRGGWWKSGCQTLILSLALADLLTTLIFCPQHFINMLLGKVFPWSNAIFCRIIAYLRLTTTFLVPMHCCMIAINRLANIVLPARFKIIASRPAGIIMCATCWLIPYTLFLLPLVEVDGKLGNEARFGACTWLGWTSSDMLTLSIPIITAYLPTGVIFGCYGAIFVFLRASDQRMAKHSQPVAAAGNAGIKITRGVKVAKMMLVTYLVFLLCYLPMMIYTSATHGPKPIIQIWLIFIYYLGACFNPVVYAMMNGEYRAAYLNELAKFRKFWKWIRRVGMTAGAKVDPAGK